MYVYTSYPFRQNFRKFYFYLACKPFFTSIVKVLSRDTLALNLLFCRFISIPHLYNIIHNIFSKWRSGVLNFSASLYFEEYFCRGSK